MKAPKTRPTHLIRSLSLALALAAFALSSYVAQATPYASGISNHTGTISFVLNESGASVGIYFPDTSSTNFLGASLSSGVHSFSLGAGNNHYQIWVTKAGAGHITQISSDSNPLCQYPSPRGVAVNNNPNDRNFGRIYVSNASANRGLFVLNADQSDALGYGNSSTSGSAKAGGIPFVASSYSPWRLFVGPDDTVYVASTSTLAAGGFLGSMNPDLTAGNLVLSGAYVGYTSTAQNHSEIMGTPVAHGSLSQGNLTISAIDVFYNTNSDFNEPGDGTDPAGEPLAIWTWNIGSGPFPSSVLPTAGPGPFGGYFIVSDSAATANNLYWMLDRSNYSPSPFGDPFGLYVYDTANNLLWDSGHNTISPNVDLFAQSLGVAVSPDGQLLATVNQVGASLFCYLTNGVPDESTLFTNTPATTAGASFGSVCFDSAYNFYTVSSGPSKLRVFSLGLNTTCVTANDATTANGTFQLIIPGSSAGVTASTSSASQGHGTPVPGVFTLTRSGTSANLSQPLTVSFTLGGTATNGTYTVSPSGIMDVTGTNGTVTFPPNVTTTSITITPVNDNLPRPTTSVVATLGSGNYNPILPGIATIIIQNTGPQLVFVSGVGAATMYNAYSNDYASFTITRWGDTNAASYSVSSFTFGGTAVSGTDFALSSPVTVNPGDITDSGQVRPLVNGQLPVHTTTKPYSGNKSIVVGAANGGGYTAGSGTATLTIIDSAYPPASVLWSDPLTASLGGANGNDDGSGQWNTTVVDGNDGNVSPVDYNTDFGLDLTTGGSWGAYGMVPLPPSGATTALRVTCNKFHGGTDTVAVNLYPTNMVFSGDYAVRFNMFVNQGSGFSSSEGPFFGINHSGTLTNWWASQGTINGGPWSADGVFYWLDNWAAGLYSPADYQEFTGSSTNAGWVRLATDSYASYLDVFKTAVFTSCNSSSTPVGGLPANNVFVIPSPIGQWADVEVKQVHNFVTMSINKTPIFSYANTNSAYTTVSTSGRLMLGYETPGTSGANSTEAATYFSNLQVVRLGAPYISSVSAGGGNITLKITSSDGDDSTSSFALQSSASAGGPYTDVSPAATFTQNPNTLVFQTVYPQNGSTRFYRIRHL